MASHTYLLVEVPLHPIIAKLLMRPDLLESVLSEIERADRAPGV